MFGENGRNQDNAAESDWKIKRAECSDILFDHITIVIIARNAGPRIMKKKIQYIGEIKVLLVFQKLVKFTRNSGTNLHILCLISLLDLFCSYPIAHQYV